MAAAAAVGDGDAFDRVRVFFRFVVVLVVVAVVVTVVVGVVVVDCALLVGGVDRAACGV